MMVGHHPTSRGVQPPPSLLTVGHLSDPPPSDQEHLGNDVRRIVRSIRTTQRIPEHMVVMIDAQPCEPRLLTHGHTRLRRGIGSPSVGLTVRCPAPDKRYIYARQRRAPVTDKQAEVHVAGVLVPFVA